MRRIIMVATVALVMAAMWVAMAMPAFADGRGGGSGGFGGGGRGSSFDRP